MVDVVPHWVLTLAVLIFGCLFWYVLFRVDCPDRVKKSVNSRDDYWLGGIRFLSALMSSIFLVAGAMTCFIIFDNFYDWFVTFVLFFPLGLIMIKWSCQIFTPIKDDEVNLNEIRED